MTDAEPERRRAARDGRSRDADAEACDRLNLPPGGHDLGMPRPMQRFGRFRRFRRFGRFRRLGRGPIAQSRDSEAGSRRREGEGE